MTGYQKSTPAPSSVNCMGFVKRLLVAVWLVISMFCLEWRRSLKGQGAGSS